MTYGTEKALYKQIKAMRANGQSYSLVAKTLLPDMRPAASKSVIYKFFAQHKDIKSNKTRRILGLPMYVNVPVCVKCGRLHKQTGTCPLDNTVPRPPRIAVLKGDPAKAAESLFGDCGLDQEVRDEFVRIVAAMKTEIEY